MSNLTRIIAATDLSAPARHAAERAAMISKETAASLDLLHVANLTPLERLRQMMGATPAAMERHILDSARHRLDDLAGSLKRRYGVGAAAHVASGALLTVLAKEMESAAAGLLVCGAKGESVLRHFLLGTTALRILSKTICPVLVVKQPPHEPYRRILVPVDFSPPSLRSLRHARSVAPRADIVLLHAFEVPFEGHLRYASVDEEVIASYRAVARQEAILNLQALRDEAGPSLQGSSVVLDGIPTWRIIEQEQERDCDLIVIGKHGANFLEESMLGSVTRHVLSESQGDVLVSV